MKSTKKSLGLYLHIPFCLRKCYYCDFCSFPGKDGQYMERYAEELCRRIELADTEGYTVDTVYFGGGTPSLLPLKSVERLMRCIFDRFDVDRNAEITFECNPATADGEYFRGLRALGVNRLSMGLQSASDRELSLLGRVHTLADFIHCFEDARAAGFNNISADLMYGIPEQTEQSFERSLEFLVSMSPEHISAYGLSVEEGTEFYRRRDSLKIADSDTQANMYLLCSELLAGKGYEKYEISNFSYPGYESRHNIRYWMGEEYLGLGVAAHSFFGAERYGCSRDISAFLRGEDITEERQRIDAEERRREYIMLRLRLSRGIGEGEYRELFGRELEGDLPALKIYEKQGFMRREGDRIGFTDKGFLVSNSILSELTDL